MKQNIFSLGLLALALQVCPLTGHTTLPGGNQLPGHTNPWPEDVRNREETGMLQADTLKADTIPAPYNAMADVSVRIENNEYFYKRDGLRYNDALHLFFRITAPNPIAELRVYPTLENQKIEALRLLPSSDFEIIDSLVFINNEHYRARVRFNDLIETSFSSLIFSFKGAGRQIINQEIPLYPYFITNLHPGDEVIELFQGEEKTIDITGNNLFNLYTDGQWHESGSFEYRLDRSGNNLRVTVKGHATGEQQLVILLQTVRPFVGMEGNLTFYPEPLTLSFNVKPSRLQYINADKDYFYFDADRRRREEVRLDHHPSFQLNRTYRIENRQEYGGRLIAEVYIKSFTSDHKVLAEMVTYDLHRASSGYLYMKDGDQTLFMTNFNIVHRPEISNIEILREGRDWTSNRNVYPGETIEVKVEGEGLLDVDIRFDGCHQEQDSIRMSDRALFFTLQVPVDISRRQVMLFKFGAGFIALNAFNFSESQDVQRDIGLVVIATIEPVRSNAKFSLPIYFGTGYLLKEQDVFAIFGPGIRLHF